MAGTVRLVRFISRRRAADGPPGPGLPLISIHDRSEPALALPPGWADVLVQRFHDTDGSQMGLEVFNLEQARELLAFADRHQGAPALTIHCQQGRSRSAAIALYIAEKYSVPCYQEEMPVTRETWMVYNRLVYERMRQADTAPVGCHT